MRSRGLSFSRFSEQWGVMRALLNVMSVRWYHVVILVLFSVLVSSFEIVGVGLLVPLLQGVGNGEFVPAGMPEFLRGFIVHVVAYFKLEDSPAITFFILASVIFIFSLLSSLLTLFSAFYGHYLQGVYLFELHTKLYQRFFSFGKMFFDMTSQGSSQKILEYTSRIVQLVRMLQNNLNTFTKLVAHLALMVFLSWRLMVLVLLIFPVLYLVSKIIMRRVNGLWEESKKISLELGRESFNMLSSLPLVWSYSQEKESYKKYSRMNERFRKVQLQANNLGYLSIMVPRFLTIITLFFVVGFIASEIQHGRIEDLPRILVFLFAASRAVPQFKVFNSVWVVMSEMAPMITEVTRLLNDKNKHRVAVGVSKFPGLKYGIEINNLNYAYDNGEAILKDVSFIIPKGKVTALVGPSGGGKSTIISLLMRFYDVDQSSIFVDGVDIRSFTLRSLRDKIALVDQDPIILNDTLFANIAYGRSLLTREEVLMAMRRTMLMDLLERLPHGLETRMGDRGVQLSGGEKQRVSIARALLKGADILLLDEATSALDSATEKQVQAALEAVVEGRTALVVAHRLATIKHADNIVYLDGGRVREQGSLEDLVTLDGHFARQWRSQLHLVDDLGRDS